MAGDARALLRRLPGCERLGPEDLDALASASRVEEFPRSAFLMREGEPTPDWYCVLESGAIQVSRLDVEADEILDYLTAGDVLDPGTPRSPALCSAVAAEPARCLLIPQSAVTRRWSAPAGGPTGAHRGAVSLLVRRARDLVKGPAVTCRATTSVGEAARMMARRSVGSVIVAGDDGRPLGIVTDRDLGTKIVAAGLPPSTPVHAIMSSPLCSIEADRPAFDALLEMTRRNLRHLGVVEGDRLVGVMSSRDIMLLQTAHPLALAREIEERDSVEGLAAVAPRLAALVGWLVEEGVGAFDLGRIVAELNDRLVRRSLALVEASLEAQGQGRATVPYSWLAAGSEGRREQTLTTDQDHGLIYDDPPPEAREAASAYFGRLASAMTATLARLGVRECEGGFMASNPRWCQPASVWREYFASWMATPHPESLLFAALYFDMRPVAGDAAPGRALWEWVCDRSPSHAPFHRHLAKAAVERHVPLGLFGRFVVERGGAHKDRLDIKASGVIPMTQGVRVYALWLGVRETNTVERLVRVGARQVITPAEVQELRGAYEVISRLRLRRQLDCLEAGEPPDNFVNPEALGKADRLLLKEAFKTLGRLQRDLEGRFQTGALG